MRKKYQGSSVCGLAEEEMQLERKANHRKLHNLLLRSSFWLLIIIPYELKITWVSGRGGLGY